MLSNNKKNIYIVFGRKIQEVEEVSTCVSIVLPERTYFSYTVGKVFVNWDDHIYFFIFQKKDTTLVLENRHKAKHTRYTNPLCFSKF